LWVLLIESVSDTFLNHYKAKKRMVCWTDVGSKRKLQAEWNTMYQAVNKLMSEFKKRKSIVHVGGCNQFQNHSSEFSTNIFKNFVGLQAPIELENRPGPNALQVQGGVVAGDAMRASRNGNCDIIPEVAPPQSANNDVIALRNQPNFRGDGLPNVGVMPVAAGLQEQNNHVPHVPIAAVAAVFQEQNDNARHLPNVVAAVEVNINEDGFATVFNNAMDAVMDVLSPGMREQASSNVAAAITSSLQTQNLARIQRQQYPGYNVGEIFRYVGISGATAVLSAISRGSAALGNLMSNNGVVPGAANAAAAVDENRGVQEFTAAFSSVVGTGVARVVSQVAAHIASSITQPNLPENPHPAPANQD